MKLARAELESIRQNHEKELISVKSEHERELQSVKGHYEVVLESIRTESERQIKSAEISIEKLQSANKLEMYVAVEEIKKLKKDLAQKALAIILWDSHRFPKRIRMRYLTTTMHAKIWRRVCFDTSY